MNDEEPVTILTKLEEEGVLPEYGSEEASGADVRANISKELTIEAGTTLLIPTGLFFEIPRGYEIQVRPRSGLALKHQLTVLNTPGTIDSDYRGELKVIMINHGKKDFIIEPGMRIAQLVVAPVTKARFLKNETLSTTSRGNGGFGHTGLH